ncbi:MAG: FAD:protein transferase [Solirubrobacterales bacterium]|nr:FAD:protein transferase [Solirubrobacterales bacterium]
MSTEAHRRFECFGGTATIHVRAASTTAGEKAVDLAQTRLLEAHRRLSRFSDESELTRLNDDPRWEVPATPLMRALADAVRRAGSRSGGLVDATLLDDIERAGYRESLDGEPSISLSEALASRAERAPGTPHPDRLWRSIGVDEAEATVIRRPGVKIDSGGIAKGLLADLLADQLREHQTYAVDCCGDIRIGGRAGQERRVRVDDPFGGGPVHELKLRDGAVATSGIGRRCWVAPDGGAGHHILDPASGEPAFTGIVQATALAPTALLAEVHAKAALLAGPKRADVWLPHGGVVIRDGGEVDVIAAEQPLTELAVTA